MTRQAVFRIDAKQDDDIQIVVREIVLYFSNSLIASSPCHESKQPVFLIVAAPFRAVLLDPVFWRLQRQSVQDGPDGDPRLRCAELDHARSIHHHQPDPRPVHPALRRVLGHGGPVGRQIRKGGPGAFRQMDGAGHHGRGRRRLDDAHAVAAGGRRGGHGRAFDPVRPRQVCVSAAAAETRGVGRRQWPDRDGHLCRHFVGRNPGRRVDRAQAAGRGTGGRRDDRRGRVSA